MDNKLLALPRGRVLSPRELTGMVPARYLIKSNQQGKARHANVLDAKLDQDLIRRIVRTEKSEVGRDGFPQL